MELKWKSFWDDILQESKEKQQQKIDTLAEYSYCNAIIYNKHVAILLNIPCSNKLFTHYT